MKTICKFIVLFLLHPATGFPQASLEAVMAAVRSANPSLIAARLQTDADKQAARTGLYLPNPEIQFDYLQGDPSASGNRVDLGITQSFRFPTVYLRKYDQSGIVMTNATLSYLQKEREVMQEAKLCWITVVGINKLMTVMDFRVQLAGEITRQAKTQFSSGGIDVIRYHHALMEFVNLKSELTKLEVERNIQQNRLVQLCGGAFVLVPDTAFPVLSAGSLNDLTGSMAGAPPVRTLENEIRLRMLDRSLAVSEWLPEFKAGFYTESVTGQTYRGVTTGMSIPLFQNSHTVKTAGLRLKSAQAVLDEHRSRQTAAIASLLEKRDKLALQVREIRTALLPVNDVNLLIKALDAGEINISEFYFECTVYFTAWSNLIRCEQDLAVTEAELLFTAGK